MLPTSKLSDLSRSSQTHVKPFSDKNLYEKLYNIGTPQCSSERGSTQVSSTLSTPNPSSETDYMDKSIKISPKRIQEFFLQSMQKQRSQNENEESKSNDKI